MNTIDKIKNKIKLSIFPVTPVHPVSFKRGNEEGWGMVLVFFLLAFLIGVTLVALRGQMTGMKSLREHDAAHDEYWRANACAVDLEASLRADLVGAFNQEAAQARVREKQEYESSRLPIFDDLATPASKPLMTFTPGDAWLDDDNKLSVPPGVRTSCQLASLDPDERCTSLLGRLGHIGERDSWLGRHVALARAYAARRGHPTRTQIDDVIVLRETFPRLTLPSSEYGFEQTNYTIEFVVESTTATAGEQGRVRRQGMITLGGPAQIIPACPQPKILELTRSPADPVEEGTPLVFAWRTLDAQGMRIDLLNPDGTVRSSRTVSLQLADKSYAQIYADANSVAAIADPSAQTGTMTWRLTAVSVCGTSESRDSVSVQLTINVRRFLIGAWSAAWSRPSGEGLRASDRFGDQVGYFQTWAEARSNGDRVEFRVRVGFTMGNENGRRLKNDIPVRNTFKGLMTLTDANGVVVEGMRDVQLSSSPAPPLQWRDRSTDPNERATLFMIAPRGGCDGRYCAAGSRAGSVMMATEYRWSIPRPPGDITGYRLSFNFDVRTIDPLRRDHRLYSRRGGTDRNPMFPMSVKLIP